MKNSIIVLLLLLTVIGLNTAYCADEKVIKEFVEISGGEKGNITFPHEKHQKTLKDCMICHNLFPKKTGVIAEMITDGKLQKKQVMNHCLACHREMKKTGEKTGPTSCFQCHNKQ
ncbi:MAG: cytochrome c family protein [Proteobacteria bacterium]|nr:cytochrome c family protein [Pseudomonadota bacterium]MBU4010083.1 cytochrome c family protein [Pseudomonadota bacterium]